MSRENVRNMKPFVSVLLIILTLFTMVFMRMEVRRMGYSVLKLSREQKAVQDQYRLQMIQLAKITRPEHVKRMAETRLTLQEAEMGQIIQMGGRIALRQ